MAKYGERDVVVLHVYVSESHAGERGFRDSPQPRAYEERAAYAREVVALKQITAPVLVDGMDDAVRTLLGDLPNVVYVVGKDGRVHYKSSWADADKVDQALAELVTADDPSRPVEPSFDTQDIGPEI